MPTIARMRSRQEIYDWLTEQARALSIEAFLITHQAKMYEDRLYLPVFIANSSDAYDDVTKLQELESSWNYQEPEPHPRIFLLPAEESDKPGWAEDYAPVQQAIDRYHEAFDAFRAATSSEEAQRALRDMGDAKTAELEASRHLSHAA